MDKNRITRATRPDEQLIAKSMVIKGRGGKFGGRAGKAVEPREISVVSGTLD
jgi:hypothetical protein